MYIACTYMILCTLADSRLGHVHFWGSFYSFLNKYASKINKNPFVSPNFIYENNLMRFLSSGKETRLKGDKKF